MLSISLIFLRSYSNKTPCPALVTSVELTHTTEPDLIVYKPFSVILILLSAFFLLYALCFSVVFQRMAKSVLCIFLNIHSLLRL
jgi:hypothetical protein